MQELKVTMLGPRSVGKTTLLTAVYEQFESNIGKTDLQLIPDEETSANLQERLADLKSLLDDFEATAGIEGSEGEPSMLKYFNFDLGRKGKKPSLKLRFQDYPGNYHLNKATTEQRSFLNNLLQESAAVLIAIDAPALMEQNGLWHQKINKPMEITNLFKKNYQELQSPKLVLFVPVKCEKYLQNEKSTQQLLQRIKEEYANLINLFNCPSLNTKVVSVITPVQTVGGVIFSRVEKIGTTPHFYFRKISHDAKYCPKDSEQPLKYLLRFLLKIHFEQQSQSWGILSFIRYHFGFDEYLEQAISQFTSGCKTNNGFEIIQGESLLKIG